MAREARPDAAVRKKRRAGGKNFPFRTPEGESPETLRGSTPLILSHLH
jgi:hypothetical protein